jgi:hypothetical protein
VIVGVCGLRRLWGSRIMHSGMALSFSKNQNYRSNILQAQVGNVISEVEVDNETIKSLYRKFGYWRVF